MFAKVLRIVAKWYGNPKSQDAFPHIFGDAIYAWKTGEFEGVSVFQAPDPGGSMPPDYAWPFDKEDDNTGTAPAAESESPEDDAAGSVEMRIDLSRIGGR